MPGIESVPLDREPYPQAPDAVWLHSQPHCDGVFDALRRSCDPERGLDSLIRVADSMFPSVENSPVRDMLGLVRKQMDTADFRRYVAGRLGFY